MDIILIRDFTTLGKAGDTVKVSPGYARNYLIPKEIALPATKSNLKRFEDIKKKEIIDKDRDKINAEGLKETIESLSVSLMKTSGEEGKLFGSVTSQDIAGALLIQGVEVDKRKIIIEESIKRLGEYDVPIKLHTDVVANLKLEVLKEE